MKPPAALVALLSLLPVAAAEAAIVADGDDLLVSTFTTGAQRNPSVAAGADGSFLVVWDDERPATAGRHIHARRFDADGALLGTEFQIDAAGASDNLQPDVIAFSGGGFVVAWRREIVGELERLIAQRIDAEGAAVGSELQVNTARNLGVEYYLSAPALGPSSDGGFIVAWASGRDPGGGLASDVFARRFDADGAAATDDTRVNADAGESTRIRPDVAKLRDDSFVVVWAGGEFGSLGPEFDTFARLVSAAGAPEGDDVHVGQHGQYGPRVAAYRDGFRVGWSDSYYTNVDSLGGGDLRVRTFDADGNALDEGFVASSPATGTGQSGYPLAPIAGVSGSALGEAGGDRFVVVWTSEVGDRYGGSSDGDGSGIFGRDFEIDGDADGPERRINDETVGNQVRPQLAFSDPLSFAVVWESEQDVVARRFRLITPECGDADENAEITATDALIVLRAAVGALACHPCLCDADGSGSIVASDALRVLGHSVGQPVTRECPACPADTTFVLQTDAPCYGARVMIPEDAIPDGIENSCEPSVRVTFRGCESSVATEGGALAYDARGCFIENEALISCDVNAEQAAAMAAAATVACGCGCADVCPSAPGVCISADGNEECDAPAVVSATGASEAGGLAVSVTSSVAQAQSTVTSSTTCGTCCDFIATTRLRLADPVSLTELVVRVESRHDPTCTDEIDCNILAGTEGPSSARLVEGGFELCVSNPSVFSGPVDLADCDLLTGDITRGDVEVLRALGGDLEELETAPGVVAE